MRAPSGGWSAPPPAYPPFVASSDGCTNRLQEYLDMALPGEAQGAGRRQAEAHHQEDVGEDEVEGEEEGEDEAAERRAGRAGAGAGGGSAAAGALGGGVAGRSPVDAPLGRVLREREMLWFFLSSGWA
jgi:hypothetical protein